MTSNHDRAVIAVDTDGDVQSWNDVAEELFGHAAAEVLGRPVDVIVPDDQREAHWAGLRRVMGGGEPHLDGAAINLPVKLASGEVAAFPARFNLVRDAHERIVGAVAVYERRRGDEEPWSPIDGDD